MRRSVTLLLLTLIGLPAGVAAQPKTSDPSLVLTQADSLALEAVAAVSWCFQQTGDEIWPGYDLTQQPYLLYWPERWAVLLNGATQGFSAYPDDWPPLGARASIIYGRLPRLAGQLTFDVRLEGQPMVAIPAAAISGDRTAVIGGGFAFIVRETFHQFQHDQFASLPSDLSEEEYPILDAENTALASLELRILMDAARALTSADTAAARGFAEEFLAIRQARWRRDPIFRIYELPQELIEGTAKYVEVRVVGAMAELCKTAGGATTPGCDVFAPIALSDYLIADFEDRLTDGVIQPPDMARNRVYPTGATLALLLDAFDADWKEQVSDAANSPGLSDFLGTALSMSGEPAEELLARAQARHDFSTIRATCQREADDYARAYQEARDSLAQLPGLHFSIETPISGLTRSRSCQGRRLTLPGRVFSENCTVYSLRGNVAGRIAITVRNSPIAEEASSDGRRRTVHFQTLAMPDIEADGRRIDLLGEREYSFNALLVSSEGLRIEAACRGMLTIAGTHVTLNLNPDQP